MTSLRMRGAVVALALSSCASVATAPSPTAAVVCVLPSCVPGPVPPVDVVHDFEVNE